MKKKDINSLKDEKRMGEQVTTTREQEKGIDGETVGVKMQHHKFRSNTKRHHSSQSLLLY